MLYGQNILKSRNISHSTNSVKKLLGKHTQLPWFYDNVFVHWLIHFKVPFSKIVTKWGLCMNFNMKPAEKLLRVENFAEDFIHNTSSFKSLHSQKLTSLKDPVPWNATGLGLVLKIVFQTKSIWAIYDDSNLYESFQGFRIIVHNVNEFPSNPRQSFNLPYQKHIKVVIKPVMFNNDLRAVSLYKRDCHFNGEKILKYFKIYSKNNCEQESLSLALVETCGCAPFYLIRKLTSDPNQLIHCRLF